MAPLGGDSKSGQNSSTLTEHVETEKPETSVGGLEEMARLQVAEPQEERGTSEAAKEDSEDRYQAHEEGVIDVKEKDNIEVCVSECEKSASVQDADSLPSDSNKADDNDDGKDENQNDANSKLLPNDQNGSDMPHYHWGQTLNEIDIRVKLPKGVRISGKDVLVEIKKKHLKVGIKGVEDPLIINGEMYETIVTELCFWNLEDSETVLICLEKANKMHWWPHLMLTDPCIDTSKVTPGSDLYDLDEDTRGAVKKMLQDQRSRQLGLPTSDQFEQQEILQEAFQPQNSDMGCNRGHCC